MSNVIEKILDRENKLEDEKLLFGGDLYMFRHSLPPILINDSNVEDYQLKLKRISEIAKQFGGDITHLAAELYVLFNSELIPNAHIQQIATLALGKISCALLQIPDIEDKIENSIKNKEELNVEITGNDYCFIVVMLNDLLLSYLSMVNFIYIKNYLNDEFLNAIRDRLNFLLSHSYEDLRQTFKTVQCMALIFERINNEMKETTLH